MQKKLTRSARVPLAALSVLLLSGCSFLAGGEAERVDPLESSAVASAEPSAGTTTEASESSPTQSEEQSSSTGAELGEITRRDASFAENAEVILNSVTADEATMTVTFSVENNGEKSISARDAFNDDVNNVEGTSPQMKAEFASVDGVFVVTSEKKRYLVGRGADGLCTCSNGIGSGLVPGAVETYSAVFAAPPESVKTVDVHIPTVGAIEDVPLKR